MSKPRLIALTGPAGCGKDTARNILEQDHGYSSLAFADPIRQMLQVLFHAGGLDQEHIYDRALKEQPIAGLNGISYRRMAQTLGTEWGQEHMGRNFWVQITANRVATMRDQGAQYIVISDLRFHHEATWVRESGGVIWRIVRDVAPVRHHESEMQLHAIQADRVIDNTRGVGELWSTIDSAIQGAPCACA